MKAPILRRFLVEDYQDAPGWFGRFISVLNQFMEQTIAVLDGRVSLGDNIVARQFSTNFSTGATYGSGTFASLSFSWTSGSFPRALLITSINREDGTVILSPVSITNWRYTTGQIQVLYIAGLAPSSKYSVTLLAI